MYVLYYAFDASTRGNVLQRALIAAAPELASFHYHFTVSART